MLAVIRTGGKQYLVKEGDVLQIEKLDVKPGEPVEFEILLTAEGDALDIGTPTTGKSAKAEVLEQGRAGKIEVVKYKPKSRYTRRVGHRQPFTKVKITKIG